MKFGAHIFLWIDHWSDNSLDLLDRARELGLDCLEIAVGDDVTIDISKTRRRAESLGLELVLSPGAVWPMECDISDDDPANRRRGVEWHRRWIELAGQVGAIAYTGAIYGHPGRVQKRHPPAEELTRTAENLHCLAEDAKRAGVQLVLEPMSHFRTHLLNTPRQAMQLVKLANHSHLGILLDTYHMVTEVRDYAAAVREVRPVLWGIHACENDRGVPGNGVVPWDALFAALRQTAFDGHVLLESYNSSLGDFAVRRGMFHNVCPDGDAFVREGMRFLRTKI
jgi:D-psicose/D-tagatose/L-ribulose 3-epimerase